MSHFRFITAGESHGPALTVTVSGMPAGVTLDRGLIAGEMARRQLGYGRGSRMKIERDEAEVLSGVRGGETIGSPITLLIRNRDHENWRDIMGVWETSDEEREKRRIHAPRPGHADLVGGIKYDRHDLRDVLERASARETAARVAAGAIAKQLLAPFGIEIRSAVVALGQAGNPDTPLTWEQLRAIDQASEMRTLSVELEEEMRKRIDEAREAGETLGGVVVTAAHGVPPGLGSYVQWDEKLDGKIGQAILSIHAVKAVAIGDGVGAALRSGSEVHDAISWSAAGYSRTSNRAGGLEGGVTNGQDVVVRAFMKPISTTRRGLPSVDIDTHEEHKSQWERSDITAVAACGVVCEAMLAIILAGAMRAKFGGDSLGEMKRNHDAYVEYVKSW